MRRYTTPDSGKILLDNLNLYDYEEKTFKTHINYAASHPTFIKGTIKENLIIVDKDFENIKRLCNLLGILDKINYLPKGFETNITEIDDSSILFMLGLARALLTNCKILMIYELPDDMDESYRQNIINLMTTQKINKTIILFTHSDDYDKYASRIFTVIKGQVNQIK